MKRTTERIDALEHEDSVLAFLAHVPIDDEPVSAGDERAIAEGWASYIRGEAESSAEAKL